MIKANKKAPILLSCSFNREFLSPFRFFSLICLFPIFVLLLTVPNSYRRAFVVTPVLPSFLPSFLTSYSQLLISLRFHFIDYFYFFAFRVLFVLFCFVLFFLTIFNLTFFKFFFASPYIPFSSYLTL